MESDVDLVVGSRFKEPGKYRQSLSRLVGGWCLRKLLCAMTGQDVSDCTSGFRAANRRVIQAFAHWYPEDYPEPEVILLLHRAGFKIDEISVRMQQRKSGQSSIGLFNGLFYVLKVATCLMLDLVREPWPDGTTVESPHVQDVDPAGVWPEPAAAGRPAAETVQA